MRTTVCILTVTAATMLTAGSARASGRVPPEGSEGAEGLTVLETLGLFVLAPLGIFAVIALAVLGPSIGKGARHRTGAGLGSDPVWVAGSGSGASKPMLAGRPLLAAPALDAPVLGDPGEEDPRGQAVHTDSGVDLGERGGASGRW